MRGSQRPAIKGVTTRHLECIEPQLDRELQTMSRVCNKVCVDSESAASRSKLPAIPIRRNKPTEQSVYDARLYSSQIERPLANWSLGFQEKVVPRGRTRIVREKQMHNPGACLPVAGLHLRPSEGWSIG